MSMRVLYVDDDRINTLLFVETCRMAGNVEVETAGSGAEAMELAPAFRPGLLVIDLHLPDTNGCDLLPRLRHALAAPQLPAFLCTADDLQVVEQPAREAGFTGCWTKPVELQRVIDELRRRSQDTGAP
jgi:two-component system, OmpR family, response regulator